MRHALPVSFPFFALFAAAGLLASGCSTIVNGTRQTVFVRSEPAGASVSVDGEHRGETPCEITLSRGSSPKDVRVEKDGYDATQTQLGTKMDEWVLGNIILGGPIGAIVDLSTGAFYEYSPGGVNVTLVPNADLESPISPEPEPPPATPEPPPAEPEPPPATPEPPLTEPEPPPATPEPPPATPEPPPATPEPPPAEPEPPSGPSPLERKLSYLREMHGAGAMTGRQVREELRSLTLPADEAAAFLNELGIEGK